MKGQDRRADKIAPAAIEWLVPGYIPRGHISLVVGVAGYGKSTWTARIVSDISTGRASGKPEKVLISATEDHVEAVTVPRLKAAQTRLSNVYPERPYRFPRDLELFEAAIAERGITAVVLDPLDDIIDNIGGQDGRQTLGELAGIAETYNVAIIAVHHFTKSGKEIDRAIGGGRGVQGVSRSIMIFGPEPPLKDEDTSDEPRDPEDKNRLVLAHWKCNLGPLQPSLLYVRRSVPHPVDKLQTIPVLDQIEESPHDADEVFRYKGGDRKATEGTRESAKNLILALLADAPKNPTDLEVATKNAGFGRKVFMKARAELANSNEIEYQEFPANVWRVTPVGDRPPADWK